ncbi:MULTISPECIES: PASTA domain-containing protein [unclassified Paenibacillus]|uniref:PASTA domain-containing protein n=1 Tax=unclassified Paenibacillus TaxID=185978 RepID=UPI0023783EB1|nr:PASTA domain-containing protein [Paenibacillus sp. MAHUQ-63]
MHNKMGTRYIPGTRIISLPQGALHNGEDTFLTRKVLLYHIKLQPGQIGADYMRTLHHKAAFIHDGFQHILDTSVEEDSVTIILQAKQGSLFSGQVNRQKWTFQAVVAMIADLGVSLLDALEERITGFSVAPENLWLDDHGKLSVINYWDEADAQSQGAIGLCRLMIQLFSGSQPVTGAFEVMHTHLERAVIPTATPDQKAALVKLVKLICQGQASLSSLVFGLRSLQPAAQEHSAPMHAVHPPRQVKLQETALLEEAAEEEDEESEASGSTGSALRKTGIGAAAVLAVAAGAWILWPSAEQEVPASVPPVQTATPAPTTSTPTPSAAPTKPAGNASKEAEPIVFPNLVGKQLTDAEKQALEVGLHYNYVIEANDLPKGTVIRQEPQPGANGMQGDNVTFWVSKGSQ